MLENNYQAKLIKRIKREFPGAVVLKNDSGYMQGIPDLTVLYEDRWAVLEDKAHANARIQPNQPYYVDLLNRMSFGAFIFPENEEEIFDELKQAFLRSRRSARVSQR